ncbi:MAG: PEP-CTERM sorting domain-containing protein [Proteobacteria bacterium]|nr:PEP-CTERM sorting domain-containing protein [Pseudomonadota bacterium]
MPGFFGDDLDALELDTEPDPFTYFSIDLFSASAPLLCGSGPLPNDILISTGDGSFGCFASGEDDIGLDSGDDLDALILWDVFRPGELNPRRDMALFSISTFSPTAITFGGSFSPADILFTDFTGDFSLWASAADIGLRPDDEVDALDTVPEPATITLMAIGFASLGFHRYRLRTRNISRKGT